MCLIIDANFISITLSPNPPDAAKPLHAALVGGRARGVYGGQLAQEYAALTKSIGLIAQLDRAGRLRKVSGKKVDEETRRVYAEGNCVSNDAHIIALARVADVRLLCSSDKKLHTDFKNPKLLKPAGRVYQNQSHAHLIQTHCKQFKKPK